MGRSGDGKRNILLGWPKWGWSPSRALMVIYPTLSLRRPRNEHRIYQIQYPDMGSACRLENLLQPFKSTTQIWVVTCHQYGISALVSQTSFRGETSGGVAKCRLFLRLAYSQPLQSRLQLQFALLPETAIIWIRISSFEGSRKSSDSINLYVYNKLKYPPASQAV